MKEAPELVDVKLAAARLRGFAHRTPFLRLQELSEELQANVFVKAETLQRTGAFKFRGAYNCISQLSEEARSKGVVTCSSGNHAAAVALAAKEHGCRAVVVMPHDAPPIKVQNTLKHGAEIVFYERNVEDRMLIARDIAKKNGGSSFVHPYDNFDVICGQGTVGLEVLEQVASEGVELHDIIVPLGGGGLTSGIALAVKSPDSSSSSIPAITLTAVEPCDYNDAQRSLAEGKIVPITDYKHTICDSLMTPHLGSITFPIIQRYVDSIQVVTDADVVCAVNYAFDQVKLVVEPGGAVALAYLLSHKEQFHGRNVCIVLTGGNMARDQLQQLLSTS